MTRRAASLVVAALLAACSPLDVSIDDRRTALDPDEAARADEILSRPLTLDLGLDAAPATFDDDGVARIDARDLDWALQGVPRDPARLRFARVELTDAQDGFEWDLNDPQGIHATTDLYELFAVPEEPAEIPDDVVLLADQPGIRWTTTFSVAETTTASLSLDVDPLAGAVVEFVLDGERVGPLRDLWRPTPRALTVELGVHAFAPGEHVLDVVSLEGGDTELGVDALVLERR